MRTSRSCTDSTRSHANDYLASELFTGDVVRELGPLLQADPEIRVFKVA
jgi:hypothetical protein